MRLKELAKLQNDYRQLLKSGITKKAMCELVIPFRDKWKLSDEQALAIARNEMALDKISKMMVNPTQTNADRIRAMSDEELVKYFWEIGVWDSFEDGKFCDNNCNAENNCDLCRLKWLQQPAEGECP